MDGQSTITFDGQQHTITLYSGNGTTVATFPAFNNVCYHAPEGNNPRAPTNGPMTDGVHSIKGTDQFGAISHLGDHGAYGPNGIIHVQDYWGVSGDSKVNGAGLHGGRSGPESCTAGCVRTTNAAMAFINLYVYIEDDPLTEIDVQRNEATILSWANNAPPDVAGHINWNIVNNDASHDSYFGAYDAGQNPFDVSNVMSPSDFSNMYFDFFSGPDSDEWVFSEQYNPPGGTPVPIQ